MSESSPRPPSPVRFVRWALLGGAVATVVVVGLRLTSPVEVQAVALSRQDIVQTLAVVGRVRVPSRVGLGATVTGTADEVRVREGDRVRAGDVLVTLDDREARAALLQAEASLAEIAAGSAEAVEQAEREAGQAQRDLERIRAVRQAGGLTQQQLEQAEQRAADAGSRLESLRAQASGASGAGEPAAVARARAELEAARARLALTRITARADGVILTRAVEPGDAVSPGRVLLEMAIDGPVQLVVFPGEENLDQLKLGAVATATSDAFPDRTFEATVALIAPAVDPTQGTVEVRLTVSDVPDYIRPEMTVSVNIEAGRRVGASVLPEDAMQGLGTAQPWVGVIRDGRLSRQDVGVGLRAGGFVEILSGLEPDEAVVLSAAASDLGKKVRVEDAAPA